jgi:hypothetical protein
VSTDRGVVPWAALAACILLSDCAPGFAVEFDDTLVRPAVKRVVMSPQGPDSSKFTLRVHVHPNYRAGVCWDSAVGFVGQRSEAGGELLAVMTASRPLDEDEKHQLILLALPARMPITGTADSVDVPDEYLKAMVDSACVGHHKWPRFPYAISGRPSTKTANPLGLFALSMIAIGVLTEGWDPQ